MNWSKARACWEVFIDVATIVSFIVLLVLLVRG